MECGCLVSTPQEELWSQYVDLKPLSKNLKKQESNSEKQKQTSYKSSTHAACALEALDSLRNDEILCDIKLETDDGAIVYGHKVVLASATPYFHAMFTSFEESKKDHVILREFDSNALKLLVDFIYTAQIMITENNVQVLLHAADLLLLNDVKEACCDFLQTLLNPTNCFGFHDLVSLYGCAEYLPSFKSFIPQNFLEVVKGDEFLCLSYEQVVKLISCNELNDSSEEKNLVALPNFFKLNCDIFEPTYFSIAGKDLFPKLMEHVRLPLASKEYLLNKVKEEPLVKNCLQCKDYLIEAFHYHLLKTEQFDAIPKTIHTIPRQPAKGILVVNKEESLDIINIRWYDPLFKTQRPVTQFKMTSFNTANTAVLNERHLIFWNDDYYELESDQKTQKDTLYMLDLFAPSDCIQSVSVLKTRNDPGVGILNNCIYAVGGSNEYGYSLKCAEVFNFSTQKWAMISEMSIARSNCGVGVLNNHLYAVGGSRSSTSTSRRHLKSVERYCPKSNTWKRIGDLSVCRSRVGVGVLNGILYAVGGCNGSGYYYNTVEAYNPSSNVWTSVSNMQMYHENPEVFALNGLLYVVGCGGFSTVLDSVKMYNPKLDTWSIISTDKISDFVGAMALNKPLNFFT